VVLTVQKIFSYFFKFSIFFRRICIIKSHNHFAFIVISVMLVKQCCFGMTNVEISEKKISEIFNAIPCVGPPAYNPLKQGHLPTGFWRKSCDHLSFHSALKFNKLALCFHLILDTITSFSLGFIGHIFLELFRENSVHTDAYCNTS
jgi:hypothetical protein